MAYKPLSTLLQRQMTRKEFLGFSALVVATLFGVVGTIRELSSHAATPTATSEPENGTVTPPAGIMSDPTASSGKGIIFGSAIAVGATGGNGVQPTGSDLNTGATITRYQDLTSSGTSLASGPSGLMSATIAGCPTQAVSFAPGSFTFYDFLDPSTVNPFSIYFRPNIVAVIGSGSAHTNFVLGPNSQSATAPSSGTNQMNKIRLGSAKVTLKGINFPVTPQRSLYNGVFLFEPSSGSLVEDVIIRGCPGNSGAPPGETFQLNNYQGVDVTVTNVELDGRDVNGVAVASTLFGSNKSTGYSRFNSVYFHDTAYGHGSTEYLSEGDFTYTKCKFENINLAGANFEQFGGTNGTGTATFNNCEWINCSYDILLDNTYRSVKCVINEPILAPGQKIKVLMHTKYYYGLPSGGLPNLQQQSDVTLIYKGSTRNDLLQFVTN